MPLRMTIFTQLLAVCLAATVLGDDWPVHRHDNHRSGATPESIAAESLSERWVYHCSAWPQPAWAGPAKWDAFHELRGLRSMRDYDAAFHVVAVGDLVLFGSSGDDSVRALDAATGRVRWCFTTDAPVRMAPAVFGGRVYFGSDDGFAYCLDLASGSLVWKHSPALSSTGPERRILNNGRLISPWPCRTGVLVDGGTAYFAVGMLPWKDSFFSAVDARTGRPEGPGRYETRLAGLTMEGPLLASQTAIFVSQGRVPPLMLDRQTGQTLGSVKGGGGSFVLLTDDDHLMHGPGNKAGWITQSSTETRQTLATFNGANAMVVSGSVAYVLADDRLFAIDRPTKKTLWETSCECPYELILAGDTLFAGGRDRVAAFDARSGSVVWQGDVTGRAHSLAVAGGRLLASTDEGAVHCFTSEGTPARVSSARVADKPNPTEERPQLPIPRFDDAADGVKLALGPYLRFTDPKSAVVNWRTEHPSPTILDFGTDTDTRRIDDATPKREHQVTLTDLRKNKVYLYTIRQVIDGKQSSTRPFECDRFFNYTRPALAKIPANSGRSGTSFEGASLLLSMLTDRTAPFDKWRTNGIALVVGCGDGQACYAAAETLELRVIGVDTSAEKVAALRSRFLDAGIYGNWITVHQVDSYDRLPIVGSFADRVIRESAESSPNSSVMPADEIQRLCRPGAGVAFERTTGSDGWGSYKGIKLGIRLPEGTGVWTHEYGLANNSAYGGESLGGARSTDDLDVQWIGRPGPRMLADRQGRKPSPLAFDGRLFVQGLHRIIAIDAYNGTIHWSLEIPVMERFNIPHDSSNWCAGVTTPGFAPRMNLYVAIAGKCWQILPLNGLFLEAFDVLPGKRADWSYDWGYVAMPKPDYLLGSAVKAGTSWTNFWGGEAWYDAKSGEVTHKICSENLFSINPSSGNNRWTYSDGLIINSTIAATETEVYFVECRNPKVIASESRRVGMPELWQDQFLVALDLETGKKAWERPIDTADGTNVFHLAASGGKLVLVASDKKYHVYAFNAADGSDAWNVEFDWAGKDHGGHLSQPAIVGGKVIVRPRVIDLETGRLLDGLLPHQKCGTHVVTDNAVVYRLRDLTLWDVESGTATGWNRLRSSCWISTIPACGMLLSPEGGGGCSCGSWLETSVGFVPVSGRP